MSSLKRGRAIAKQAWYAVLRHKRGNPDTCYTVTYPCCCTLSTLPVDGTLAPNIAVYLNRGHAPKGNRRFKYNSVHELSAVMETSWIPFVKLEQTFLPPHAPSQTRP
jgi:hypothetical protein